MPSLVRRCSALLFLLLAFSFMAVFSDRSAKAHEGHDHGPPPPPLPATVNPRVQAHSDHYELVGVAAGDRLIVFLDRYADNSPVTDATIDILAGVATIKAEPQPDGTYAVALPALRTAGKHDLTFDIRHAGGDDLLAGSIEIPAATASTVVPAGDRATYWPPDRSGLLTLFAGVAVAGAGGYLTGRWRRRAAAIVMMAAAASSLAAVPAEAHEGHAPSPAPSSEILVGEAPRRLSNGSVFLPKASQRLLSVQTQSAAESETQSTSVLVGRIIPDPNRSGVVQSINGGRVAAPPGGLPRLGQSVRAGDVLATVQPALPLADQSTLAEKARELEGLIRLSEQRLQRLNRLTSGTVARSQVEDIELEITNTERRLASLRDAKLQPEVLTAPIDGVVSASRVVNGQVVQGQDILFQIVDPQGLWVEALAFDLLDAGSTAAAEAETPQGARMSLRFEGRGRALQQQATVLHYAIVDPPQGTAVGAPVTVLAPRADRTRGMVLPRDAVVRGPGGESIVWQHVDPERFTARQVRVSPFDSRRVLIQGGIAAGDRIVVHGAELLSQVR